MLAAAAVVFASGSPRGNDAGVAQQCKRPVLIVVQEAGTDLKDLSERMNCRRLAGSTTSDANVPDGSPERGCWRLFPRFGWDEESIYRSRSPD
jgi:hypothetical protein